MRLQLPQDTMSRQALRAEHLHKEISFSTLVVCLVCMTHNLLRLTVKILSSLYHTAGFMPMLLLTATACCEGCVQSPLHIQTSKFTAQPPTLPLRVTYQREGLTNWGALGEPRGFLLSEVRPASVCSHTDTHRGHRSWQKRWVLTISYIISHMINHISHFPRWLVKNKQNPLSTKTTSAIIKGRN